MSKHDRYDPEHERTCRGCYKVLKTKDGVLEGKYKFTCSECHHWYKKRDRWITGGVIVVILIALILFLWWFMKETSTEGDDEEQKIIS